MAGENFHQFYPMKILFLAIILLLWYNIFTRIILCKC
jgi:hypothetical protein